MSGGLTKQKEKKNRAAAFTFIGLFFLTKAALCCVALSKKR